MGEDNWKLGIDLSMEDNLLDPITFEDLILSIKCNCKFINRVSIRKELDSIVSQRLEDMEYLLENNFIELVEELKGENSV